MLDYASTWLCQSGAKVKNRFFSFLSKNLSNNYNSKIKGSFGTPCFCVAIIAIFLFLFIPFSCGFILKSLAEKNELSSVDLFKESKEIEKQNLFVSQTREFSLEPSEFLLMGEASLKASSSPNNFSSQVLGALIAGYEQEPETAITEYIVEKGDTLLSLAARFNISAETIRWANNLSGSTIQIGQKLVILPVSGVVHYVKSGDTISEMAKTYQGQTAEIVAFNQLASENDIFIGDLIIIPNGKMPAPVIQQKQTPASTTLVEGQFIVPVSSPYLVTQWGHGAYDPYYGRPAIDFSHTGNPCGKPVFAAAGGTVQLTGYDRIAGNYIRILHPNGVVTFYGHLSQIEVKKGNLVNVGQIIGRIGNTGFTIGMTGCHLHFEVRGAKNPFLK